MSPNQQERGKSKIHLSVHTTAATPLEPDLSHALNAGSPCMPPVKDPIPTTIGLSESDLMDEFQPYEYQSAQEILEQPWGSFITKRFFRCLFLQSVPIYLPIHAIPVLLFKRKQLLETPKTVLWNMFKSTAKSCMFLTSFQTLFAIINYYGNILFKGDLPQVAAFGGLIAPLAILFESANRRKEMMLYCIPRVSEILERYGQESGWFTDMSKPILILFALAMGALMYFYHLDSKHIKPSIRSLLSLIAGY